MTSHLVNYLSKYTSLGFLTFTENTKRESVWASVSLTGSVFVWAVPGLQLDKQRVNSLNEIMFH